MATDHKYAAVVIIAIGYVFVIAFPISIIWNALMPQLFGMPELTYWQAFGLIAMIRGITR